MINRSNYEIWVVDMIDGNLDEEGLATLNEFLGKNPDLRSEFDLLPYERLVPEHKKFRDKDKLYKSIDDLEIPVIDYLSVASLERDITPEQTKDLYRLIDNDPIAIKRYESIQKLKLSPVTVICPGKRNYKRIGKSAIFWRFSTAIATVAAVLTLIIMISRKPVEIQENMPVIANNNAIITEKVVTEEIITDKPEEYSVMTIEMPPEEVVVPPEYSEILSPQYVIYEFGVPKIPVNHTELLSTTVFKKELAGPVELNQNLPEPVPENVDRTIIDKFIARNFREKVLDEENATDTRIRGYEIAEAWISTLNKMWESDMDFVKTTDEKGEVESVYFSAGLISFSSPVKKSLTGL